MTKHGDAPEKPEGDAPSEQGEAPGEMKLSLSDISVGTQVAVTFDADGNVESVEIIGGMQSGMGQPGGGMSSADITYSALKEFSEDTTVEGETIASTGTDENAILVTDGEVTVTDSTITRESDDSTGGDNASFYGVGATLLSTGGTLTATGSEAVCIEGLNSLTLTDCDLSGSMPENEQNDCDWNIILYQSMSGDSEVGNSTFKMTGGSISATNGGMFYTTNTESTFILENIDITYADENDFFLRVTGNANQRGWGTSGDNGAQCSFTAINQKMEGDVIWDTISTLDMEMTDGSVLTGAFIDDESAAGNGGDGYANLTIDSSSKWIVTGDSVLTSLTNNGTIVDEDGNTVSIVGTDGTVYVEGTSSYTITVSEYAD